MVLNSHHSLTASTTLASIVSAVILTAIGLCIPYTERAAHHRAAPPSAKGQVSTNRQALHARPDAVPADAALNAPGRIIEQTQP